MPSQYDPSKILPAAQMIDTSYPQDELDAIYTRSVHSFFCPVCSMGRCRVIVKSQSLQFEQWQYECGYCQITGTKTYIYNARFCSVCGRALNEYGRCPSGCVDSTIARAIIGVEAQLVQSWMLLRLVRLAEQERWYSGQSVWLVPGKAFLKESAGWVRLHVVGEGRSLPVYILSPMTGWGEVVGLDRHFAEWLKGE